MQQSNWSFLEQTVISACCSSIQCKVVTSCLICIPLCWYLRRALFVDNHGARGDFADDVKCNDPTCLRCHSSSSQRHLRAFHSNVMLLRRLVKLEPQLFEGMREEIWSAIDDKLSHSHQYQEGQRKAKSLVFGDTRNSLMQKSWTWMTRALPTYLPLPSTFSDLSTSKAAGQNPTVFFLPGLETTPVHDEHHCRNNKCPCFRLWNTIQSEKNDERKVISSKMCYHPTKSMTGDILALRKGFEIIRRELLEFLSHENGSIANKQNGPINTNKEYATNVQSSEKECIYFQSFDPKVYTHASKRSHQLQQPEWSSIYLYHRGIRQSNLIDKYFSQTMHILETHCPHRLAGKCGLGSVYFSKLGRNTKVKQHCGPTNIRWRCHLPLIVPQTKSKCDIGSSSISINTETSSLRVGLSGVNERCVEWKEGKPILFDDSYLHSAVYYGCDANDTQKAFTLGNDGTSTFTAANNANNNSNMNGARIVLIVDFWHPSLSEMDRTALGVLYPPGS